MLYTSDEYSEPFRRNNRIALRVASTNTNGHTKVMPDEIHETIDDFQYTAARSSNRFGIYLWHALRQQPGNLMISPASLSTALTMGWVGARGETRAAMGAVLCLRNTSAVAGLGRILSGLQTTSPQGAFCAAARLFQDATLKGAPSADREALDLAGDPEGSRLRVNQWIAEQTERQILELLVAGSIDRRTKLVLASALCLSSDWTSPFDVSQTRERPFWTQTALRSSRIATAMLMHQAGTYRTGVFAGGRLIELPHAGGTTSTIIMLPDEVDGITRVEETLDANVLEAQIRALAPNRLDLWLPCLDAAASGDQLDLQGALSKIGMAMAFDAKRADFSGLGIPSDGPGQELRLGAVAHRTIVQITERGTKMAAASAVVVERGSKESGIPFTIDRPFLILTIDRKSSLILSLGRVVDPGRPKTTLGNRVTRGG